MGSHPAARRRACAGERRRKIAPWLVPERGAPDAERGRASGALEHTRRERAARARSRHRFLRAPLRQRAHRSDAPRQSAIARPRRSDNAGLDHRAFLARRPAPGGRARGRAQHRCVAAHGSRPEALCDVRPIVRALRECLASEPFFVPCRRSSASSSRMAAGSGSTISRLTSASSRAARRLASPSRSRSAQTRAWRKASRPASRKKFRRSRSRWPVPSSNCVARATRRPTACPSSSRAGVRERSFGQPGLEARHLPEATQPRGTTGASLPERCAADRRLRPWPRKARLSRDRRALRAAHRCPARCACRSRRGIRSGYPPHALAHPSGCQPIDREGEGDFR